MNRVIVVGSPRTNGRSAALAEELFEACIEECPDDQISLIPLSSLTVLPCQGCNVCMKSEEHACHLEDDMADIREVLDDADELTIVSPVYFAGAPATLKAFLDRLQPYFWTKARYGNMRPVKSALFTAGFKLERVLNWVEKISEKGEILDDAEVTEVIWPDRFAKSQVQTSDAQPHVQNTRPKAQKASKGTDAPRASSTEKQQRAKRPHNNLKLSQTPGKSGNR